MTAARLSCWPLVLLIVIVLAKPGRGEEAPKSAAELLQTGSHYFNLGCHLVAQDYFEKLLLAHPHSDQAPEAAYRLACCSLLREQPAEAKKTLDRLVQDYLGTPWGQLAVRVHLLTNDVLKLADQCRDRARAGGGDRHFEQAAQLYQICFQRLTDQEAARKKEVYYKLGDCCRTIRLEDYLAAMRRLAEADPEGEWGRLASFRLVDSERFAWVMEDFLADELSLVALQGFVDTADECLPFLKGQDLTDAQYLRACALSDLDRKEEGLEVFRALLRDHPDCRWAVECAFWLAEHAFASGDSAAAREAYLDLARRFPHHPRAGQARRWAEWLADGDAAWSQLEQASCALFSSEWGHGLAWTFAVLDENDQPRLSVRFAFQDSHTFYFRLAFAAHELLLAGNPEGLWYGNGQTLFRAPNTLALPLPELRANADANTINWNWPLVASGVPAEPGQDQLVGATSILAELCSSWLAHYRKVVHFHQRVEGQATVLRLERFTWRSHAEEPIEIEFNPDGTLRQLRGTYTNANGQRLKGVLADFVLGRKIDDESFTVAIPPGVPCQEVPEINMLEVFSHFFRVLADAKELTNRQMQAMPKQ